MPKSRTWFVRLLHKLSNVGLGEDTHCRKKTVLCQQMMEGDKYSIIAAPHVIKARRNRE
jgi:hypothetical protein